MLTSSALCFTLLLFTRHHIYAQNYNVNKCGSRPSVCDEWYRSNIRANYNIGGCGVKFQCKPTIYIPEIKSNDPEIIARFFSVNGFEVTFTKPHDLSNDNHRTFVYPPYGTKGYNHVKILAIDELDIVGTKDNVCLMSKRSEEIFKNISRDGSHPRCFVFPEQSDSFMQYMDSVEKSNAQQCWLFKSTTGNTYGGLSIMFYDIQRRQVVNLMVHVEDSMRRGTGPAFVHKHDQLISYKSYMSPWPHGDKEAKKGVFQRLVEQPLLIDGRSHSFRVFALVTSTFPLRLYVWPDSYCMVSRIPYKYVDTSNPTATLESVCAIVVNSFFQKRHCWQLSGPPMRFMRLETFFKTAEKTLSMKGIRRTAQQMWDDTKEQIEKVMLASYEHYFAVQGHQLLGIDMIVSNDGTPHVLEINRSPGTTEDDAGRKKKMHKAWIAMTGSFTHHYEEKYMACKRESDPFCKIQILYNKFAQSQKDSGGFQMKELERDMIYDYERERYINANGWEELWPRSYERMDKYRAHMQTFNPTAPRTAVWKYVHEVLYRWLKWCEKGGNDCHPKARSHLEIQVKKSKSRRRLLGTNFSTSFEI